MDHLSQFLSYAVAPGANSANPPPLTSETWTDARNNVPRRHHKPEKPTADHERFSAFCKQTDAVRCSITRISDNVCAMQELRETKIHCVDPHNAKKLDGRIFELSEETNELARAAKSLLDILSKNTASLKETQDSIQANSAIIRIEENQYTHLVMKLTMAMAEYQRHQSVNEAFYKAQTQRQIKIKYTNPDGSAIDDATAAQLAEQVLENNTTSYIFQQSKDVLASIIETRNDIYRIEQSMQKLNQLFKDLAFLIQEQEEVLDVVLINVQRSTDKVEYGRMEMKTARKYKRSIRNKILGSAAVVGAAALVGGVAATAVVL